MSKKKSPKKLSKAVNPMLSYIDGFSKKEKEKKLPLVDDSHLNLMTREELAGLLKKQQEFIAQHSAKNKSKSRKQNKDLRSTLTSHSSKKPVKAVHHQQPQTQINNFFLNVANPADASNIISSGLGAGASQTNLSNVKPTPSASIPSDMGY